MKKSILSLTLPIALILSACGDKKTTRNPLAMDFPEPMNLHPCT